MRTSSEENGSPRHVNQISKPFTKFISSTRISSASIYLSRLINHHLIDLECGAVNSVIMSDPHNISYSDLKSAWHDAYAAPQGSSKRYDFLLFAYPDNQQQLTQAMESPLGSRERRDQLEVYFGVLIRRKGNRGFAQVAYQEYQFASQQFLGAVYATPPGSSMRHDFLLQACPSEHQQLTQAMASPLGSSVRAIRFRGYEIGIKDKYGLGWPQVNRDIASKESNLACQQRRWTHYLAAKKEKLRVEEGLREQRLMREIEDRKRDEAEYEETYGGDKIAMRQI